MNRRNFFATTIGALVASVWPVKAEVDTTNMFLPYPYYELWKNSRQRKKVYPKWDKPWAVQFNGDGTWYQITMKEAFERLNGVQKDS
jgi:hypothetical protein